MKKYRCSTCRRIWQSDKKPIRCQFSDCAGTPREHVVGRKTMIGIPGVVTRRQEELPELPETETVVLSPDVLSLDESPPIRIPFVEAEEEVFSALRHGVQGFFPPIDVDRRSRGSGGSHRIPGLLLAGIASIQHSWPRFAPRITRSAKRVFFFSVIIKPALGRFYSSSGAGFL